MPWSYHGKHQRLLALAQHRFAADQVKDLAIAFRWREVWPPFAGVAVVAIGWVGGQIDHSGVAAGVGLVVGFGLCIAGWLVPRPVLFVTATSNVLVVAGRRRSYEPVQIEERVPLNRWDADRGFPH